MIQIVLILFARARCAYERCRLRACVRTLHRDADGDASDDDVREALEKLRNAFRRAAQ